MYIFPILTEFKIILHRTIELWMKWRGFSACRDYEYTSTFYRILIVGGKNANSWMYNPNWQTKWNIRTNILTMPRVIKADWSVQTLDISRITFYGNVETNISKSYLFWILSFILVILVSSSDSVEARISRTARRTSKAWRETEG